MNIKPAGDADELLVGLPAVVETRPIGGFADYRVGADGSVWSRRGRVHSPQAWRRLKLRRNPEGYAVIALSHDGRQKLFKVARLVLLAFVGPPPTGSIACHRFGDRSDDRLINLKWDTRAGNAADRRSRGTHAVGERSGKNKLTEAQAREILTRVFEHQESYRALATEFGITKNAIGFLVRGITWPHIPRPKREV